jgi:hypothetical protein
VVAPKRWFPFLASQCLSLKKVFFSFSTHYGHQVKLMQELPFPECPNIQEWIARTEII